MSGYWDAIDREARALPAAAQPRPRSLFEGEASVGDEGEPFAVFSEVDADPGAVATPVETRTEAPTRQAIAEPSRASPAASESRSETPPVVAQPSAATSEQPDIPFPAFPPATDASASAMPSAQPPASREPVSRRAERLPQVTETPAPSLPQVIEQVAEQVPPAPPRQDAEPAAEAPPPVTVAAQALPETVVAQPIALPLPEAHEAPPDSAEPAPHEPSLTIEIGEIHIRIAPEHDAVAPVVLRPARAPAAAPLDTFLRRTGEGRR
jgi:hypothetical protein